MRGLWQRAMYAWETHLTTRDTNRIVRPLEWGIEWTRSWPQVNGNFPHSLSETDNQAAEQYFLELNRQIVHDSDRYFSYQAPGDFRLEERLPELFPTNTRQQRQLEKLEKMSRSGKLKPAQFLRLHRGRLAQHASPAELGEDELVEWHVAGEVHVGRPAPEHAHR